MDGLTWLCMTVACQGQAAAEGLSTPSGRLQLPRTCFCLLSRLPFLQQVYVQGLTQI